MNWPSGWGGTGYTPRFSGMTPAFHPADEQRQQQRQRVEATVDSPGYTPTPTWGYSPLSPAYMSTSPAFPATGPGYSPTSPAYSPTSPSYSPASPTSTPASPADPPAAAEQPAKRARVEFTSFTEAAPGTFSVLGRSPPACPEGGLLTIEQALDAHDNSVDFLMASSNMVSSASALPGLRVPPTHTVWLRSGLLPTLRIHVPSPSRGIRLPTCSRRRFIAPTPLSSPLLALQADEQRRSCLAQGISAAATLVARTKEREQAASELRDAKGELLAAQQTLQAPGLQEHYPALARTLARAEAAVEVAARGEGESIRSVGYMTYAVNVNKEALPPLATHAMASKAALLAYEQVYTTPLKHCSICDLDVPCASCTATPGHSICGACWPEVAPARALPLGVCKDACPVAGCAGDVPWHQLRLAPCKATTAAAERRAAKVASIADASEKEVTCPVCMELMVTARQPTALGCGHVFCKTCLPPARGGRCPCCRAPAGSVRITCFAVQTIAEAVASAAK